MNIRNARFLRWFGINGIVLWPFVLYADKEPPAEICNHESIHLDQIRRAGVVGFYVRYLREYLAGRRQGLGHHQAYRNISFEQEAYQNQHDLFYLSGKDDRTSPTNTRSRGQS